MNVEKFNGENFRQWKFQIKCALKAKGIDLKQMPATDTQQWIKNDGMAMYIITSSMELSQITLIENCESASEIMSKLESIYEQKTELNKMLCHERFYQYKMSPTDTMAQHIAKVENLAKQLKEGGEDISDAAVMTKILCNLPAKYRSLRQAWLSLDPKLQTIQNLTARLLDEEASLTSNDEFETALVADKKFSNHTNSKVKKNSFSKQQVSSEATSSSSHRFVCYNCNKRGHFARDCRFPKKSGKKSQEQNTKLAFNAECLQSETDSNVWILDSGSSAHMGYKRELFHELQEYSAESPDRIIKLGNKKEIQAHGHGTVLIKRYVNGQWEQSVLQDVLYVPDLRRNLFSEGAATRKGYVIMKKGCQASILKDNKVVMSATLKENNLYVLNIKSIVSESCNLVQTSLKVWHERLGHLNIKEVQNMCKNGALPVTLTGEDKNFICEACQYGKQSRLPFEKSSRGKTEPGSIVYSDVCGPVQQPSVSGARYFVLFKDGATSYRHVYIIKHKSDVLDCFKKYVQIVKNKFQHNVRILHTDNGLEYINQEFKAYLDAEGITHERTAPYTPEQNGRAEREIRTIMESARSMLYARDMPLKLWAEAVSCAVYLLNRTSSSQTKDISPYELWTGNKPCLKHVRVFGSQGYVHVPDEKRKKLDKKSKAMILVGYDNQNYKMYDPETNKITISRNVCFDEYNIPLIRKNITKIDIDEEESCEPCTSSSPSRQMDSDLYTSDESPKSCRSNDESYQPSQLLDSDEEETHRITLRPRRPRKEVNLTEFNVPTTYQEAVIGQDSQKWKDAIFEELQSHSENKTWDMVKRPEKKTITSKWVFSIKRKSDGQVERYKARLCARGFTQVKDIDYKETFSPTVRYDSIRILLSIAAREKFEIQQFDVKTAFLYGELDEDIYMEVPEGVQAASGYVCKLNKSLYGLKQASRCWNKKFTSFLLTYGFKPCYSDNCIFVGQFNNYKVVLLLYVDDALLFSKCKHVLSVIIKDLMMSFKIKVLNLSSFVGMDICKSSESIVIHQKQYVEQLIDKFCMSDANPCSTPADNNVVLTKSSDVCEINFPYREAVGALLFLASVSRPDIAFAVNIVSRYINNPNQSHVNAVKRIIRYLIKTKNVCIKYTGFTELIGFSDADYGSDLDSRRSNTGYVFMMNNGPVTWCSRKQNTVALSTTESEYMAAAEAAKELLWLQQLLVDIGEAQQSISLCIDNQSAIKLIHNPVFHRRSKHIDIRYNFIREKVESKSISIVYVSSANQLADFLTKALPVNKFVFNRDQVLSCFEN